MPLWNEMTPEEIEARIQEDTSFGMPNDEVAADVISREGEGIKRFQKSYIRYLKDKEKWGPWLSTDVELDAKQFAAWRKRTALLHKMTPEEIESRIQEDTSFGMLNDEVAVDIIARDSVSAKHFRMGFIKYLQDKKKFGPWMVPETASDA